MLDVRTTDRESSTRCCRTQSDSKPYGLVFLKLFRPCVSAASLALDNPGKGEHTRPETFFEATSLNNSAHACHATGTYLRYAFDVASINIHSHTDCACSTKSQQEMIRGIGSALKCSPSSRKRLLELGTPFMTYGPGIERLSFHCNALSLCLADGP